MVFTLLILSNCTGKKEVVKKFRSALKDGNLVLKKKCEAQKVHVDARRINSKSDGNIPKAGIVKAEGVDKISDAKESKAPISAVKDSPQNSKVVVNRESDKKATTGSNKKNESNSMSQIEADAAKSTATDDRAEVSQEKGSFNKTEVSKALQKPTHAKKSKSKSEVSSSSKGVASSSADLSTGTIGSGNKTEVSEAPQKPNHAKKSKSKSEIEVSQKPIDTDAVQGDSKTGLDNIVTEPSNYIDESNSTPGADSQTVSQGTSSSNGKDSNSIGSRGRSNSGKSISSVLSTSSLSGKDMIGKVQKFRELCREKNIFKRKQLAVTAFNRKYQAIKDNANKIGGSNSYSDDKNPKRFQTRSDVYFFLFENEEVQLIESVLNNNVKEVCRSLEEKQNKISTTNKYLLEALEDRRDFFELFFHSFVPIPEKRGTPAEEEIKKLNEEVKSIFLSEEKDI